MATPTNRGNGAQRAQLPPGPMPGLTDAAPRSRQIYEYDVPDAEGLHGEVTPSFGSIRTVALKLLTPLEEKDAASAAKDDGMQLAYELARRSVAGVINETGEWIAVHNHDGTSLELWAQIHPKIRQLVMQAYADSAVPDKATAASFLKGRRIRV